MTSLAHVEHDDLVRVVRLRLTPLRQHSLVLLVHFDKEIVVVAQLLAEGAMQPAEGVLWVLQVLLDKGHLAREHDLLLLLLHFLSDSSCFGRIDLVLVRNLLLATD